jgi:acetoacetyl-CoA synthetase
MTSAGEPEAREIEPGQRLWTPSPERVAGTAMTRFRSAVAADLGLDLPDSTALHSWSVTDPAAFWEQAWRRLGLVGDRGEGPAIVAGDSLAETSFFPGATVNVAANVLAGPDDAVAVVALDESGGRRTLTRAELRAQAASFAATLRALGVGRGDRVAAWMPNVSETVVAFLGSAMVGAVFSSASPDFGVPGVLDRFGQIAPKVLVAADGYRYGGKAFRRMDRLADVLDGLPERPVTFVVPFLGEGDPASVPGARPWAEAVATRAQPEYAALPFDHPSVVLYSSGTTGIPKAIVHRGGGVLLKHLVEHQLHCDIRPGDRVLYYTTCGWMMWNWLVSALASGATIVLYDGSPTHPRPDILFEVAAREGVTLFGTSAKFLDASAKSGLRPGRDFDLATVRTITSTGSPLSPEGFGFVYDEVRADVHLASISGGTDIVGCFVLGDPTRPVHAGEIQGPALGLDVDVVDGTGASLAAQPGVRGDLVCRNRFPSMPLGFWGDADGGRYRAAYFEANPGIWTHGDFASRTSHGGFVIHGRSDATLNAGGVRIGTAEIYRQVEALPEVTESLAIGQEWDDDTRIVLFVVLAPGAVLDEQLQATIRKRLRDNCSPRHVPARIVAVPDLPRTRSGKLAELAVRDVVHGRSVANAEALANPEALEHLRDRPELR